MKTDVIILAILAVFVLLFIGNLTISFKPFSISLPYWHRVVGVLLLCLGMSVYSIGERAKGYKDGLNDGAELVIKYAKDKINHEQTGTHSND